MLTDDNKKLVLEHQNTNKLANVFRGLMGYNLLTQNNIESLLNHPAVLLPIILRDRGDRMVVDNVFDGLPPSLFTQENLDNILQNGTTPGIENYINRVLFGDNRRKKPLNDWQNTHTASVQ